jgi:hypothetical protein
LTHSSQDSSELAKRVTRLESDLFELRYDLIALAPPAVEIVLRRYAGMKTWDGIREWQNKAVEAAIQLAVPLSYGHEERAICPVCGDSGRTTYVKGFKLPTGLEWHLKGQNNSRHCVVMKAAMDLAGESRRRAEGQL